MRFWQLNHSLFFLFLIIIIIIIIIFLIIRDMSSEEEECGNSILTAGIKFSGKEEYIAFMKLVVIIKNCN